MKRSLLLISLILLSLFSYAQDDPNAFSNRINYIFQHVNKSQIPTGILQEYGIDFTNVNNYNGLVLNDSNKVILNEWSQIYTSLYTAQITSAPNLPSFSSITSKLDTIANNSLLIMHYNFNSLKTDAVSNNLFSITNDQIYDVPNRPHSPYNQQTAFAICVNNAWFETNYVSLVFRPELFYTNTGKTVSALYLDKGNGYQPASWNVATNFEFSSVGIHTIKAKIVYTDATAFESHFNVNVGRIETEGGMFAPFFAPLPDSTITALRVHSGSPATGKMQIRISDQNGGVIRKPLIVVEGFDASSLLSNIPNLNVIDFMDNIHQFDIGIDLDLAGYDIIYLDYGNGTDEIQDNAYLLQDVIKWVNHNKAVDAGPNVVLGLSMGALVARYALKDMEDRNEGHDVRLNISFDGPHNGAYIPLAGQAMAGHLKEFTFSVGLVGIPVHTFVDGSDLIPQLSLINSPAARQMMTYRLLYSGSHFDEDNGIYNSFMTEYHNKGLPTLCSNIAVSNGSSCGTGQAIPPGGFYVNVSNSERLDWGQKFLVSILSPFTIFTNKWKFAISGLIGILQNKTTISSELKLGALATMQNTEIYKAKIGIKRKIFGLININTYLINKSYFSGAKLPMDSSPGGIFNFSAFASSLPSQFASYIQHSSFSFVPTVSALDLATNISEYTPYYLTYPYQEMVKSAFPKPTPFSAVNVGFQGNEGHISFTAKNSTWMFSKIQDTVISECYSACPIYTSLNINGLNSICTSADYGIANLPVGTTIAWSVDNPSRAALTTTGSTATLTKVGNGTVILTAVITTPCGVTTKTRSIVMGTEKPVITGMIVGPLTLGVTITLTAVGNYPPGTTYIWGTVGQVQITSGHGTNTVTVTSYASGAPNPKDFTVYCAVVRHDCGNSSNNSSVSGTVNYPPNMMIYPNPASEELFISFDGEEKGMDEFSAKSSYGNSYFDYKIFNRQGILLKSGTKNDIKKRLAVNIKDVADGQYFLHIIQGKEVTKKQIIIKH